MSGPNKRTPTLAEAKANFAAAAAAFDPLKSLKEHPMLGMGATTALGALIGFSGLRLMRGSLFRSSLALAVLKRLLR